MANIYGGNLAWAGWSSGTDSWTRCGDCGTWQHAGDECECVIADASSDDEADPILDVGGYLPCGCHGTQRDHTCGPQDSYDYDI